MEGIFITEIEHSAPAGRRLAVKDLFDTAGIRTTYGSAVFADHVPTESASAVTLLEAAGYQNVGKANLHEFAYGTTSQNLHYGTVPNPAAPGRVAGGSSGGSAAAIVAGLADVALGTDSGGSIRIPAACCGITGFKPSYGLVAIDGVFPLAPSYDHVGPMATNVAGCRELMAVLAPGFSVSPLELGSLSFASGWLELADPLVAEAVGRVAALVGAEALALPEPTGTAVIFGREVADVHRELFAEQPELYGENVAPKIERCLEISDGEVAAGRELRLAYREAMLAVLGPFDLLITPTLRAVAPPDDVWEPDVREQMIRFTYPFNLLGWPALALPCGTAEHGFPASLQVIGRPGDDARVLAAGAALEAAIAHGLGRG